MASTTVSAVPVPKASPEASPAYCHGFGQPCMKPKRSIETIPELLARNTLSAESTPFTESQNDATITTNSLTSTIAQSFVEPDSTQAKRSPAHRYCWMFGQPCMKKREGSAILMPGSFEGTSR
ncbi:Histone-lysine N-methyltransferase, H3 lysine-4 specific [Venturia inaequalis]|nr:Histone-lysine N-methyltransferase, H3 lysine-4 specific [Venturia inaequalis]